MYEVSKNLELLKYFIKKFNINIRTHVSENEISFLHYACAGGNMDCVAFLISMGADIQKKRFNRLYWPSIFVF